MQGLEIKKLINRAWLHLIFGLIVSLIVIVFAIIQVQKDLYMYVINEIGMHHKVVTSLVQKFQEEQGLLIEMLRSNADVEAYSLDGSHEKELINTFYNVVKSQKNIMQLRFIDLKGDEKVRLDKDKNSKITIFTKQKLQNKSDRYYVQEFLKLPPNEIGFSKFDLNIEHGVVERPFNPTLRMGKGVYVDGKLRGIIVINFYMQDWIEHILNFTHVKIAIIDKEGDFMMHYDPKWAWSAYLQEPKKAKQYPLIENMPNFQEENQDFYQLSDSIIAKNMQLFSDEVLVAYRLEKSLTSIIVEKVLELLGVFIFAFAMIIVPMFYLIYRYVQLTKENSAFLKNIMDNMFDALIVIDKKAIIQHINYPTEHIFGYTSHELIGHNIKMLVPESHRALHDGYVENYKNEERTIIGKQRDLKGVNKDGLELPISLAVTKIVVNSKVYYIGAVRDLREVKQLEAMTKKQEALLIHQSKLASMGEMIGAIAHQWRQPLNELSIRIQKLKYDFHKDKIDEQFINEFIEKNKNTIKFMSATIDDFRNFFRIDKMKHDFYLKESILEVLRMLETQLQEHNIAVEIEGEDFIFTGFKSEFQQVIMNLIANSKDALIEHSIQSPKLKIAILSQEILIQDNAGGIPQKVLERVFEPYFTTKEQGKGTGMGLYMSKMIIEENMDGKISIANKNDGALVLIELKGNNNARRV